MAQGSDYEAQLLEASRLVSERCGLDQWELVYQSRSGPPHHPWLEPDILDRLRQISAEGVHEEHLLVVPIGFLSDHLEVLYDLDTEALALCEELNLEMTRVATVGAHPRFVEMIGQLVRERCTPSADRLALGSLPAAPHACPEDCCPYPIRRPSE